MSHQKRWIIPFVLFLFLAVFGIYTLLRQTFVAPNGDLKASGTVETVEVKVGAELSGKVSEVLVEEGQMVHAGEALFRLDDALLASQRLRALAALESAQAALKVAESGLQAAQTNLSLAQANLELARTQYRIAVETARKSDERARATAWQQLVPYQFNLPVWYYEKSEQISALEKEVSAAQEAMEDARTTYREALEKGGYTQILQAEERLALARVTFEIAKQTLDRAKAANDEDESEEENGDTEHADEATFEKAEDALEDAAQEAYDQAKAELEAAQKAYLNLLKDAKLTDEIIKARASWAVAIERYEAAQDRLLAQYHGADSLQILAAESVVKQAEVAVQQAQIGVSQAEAKLEQAQAAIAQAQAEVDLLDTQIAKLTVHAPMDGVVLSRAIEVGEVLQAAATAVVLGNLDELTVTVYIPEDQYGRIQLGMSAMVTADSFPGERFEAVVQKIGDQAEFTPRNVQTEEGRRTTVFAIQLRLSNPQGKLKPGMPVDVRFVW